MNEWWKSPVLQGPENDYGQYDYMIEEIPQNEAKWKFDVDKRHCDYCGKYRHILFCATQYFRTLDGYDSLTYDECWICMIKEGIHSRKRKIQIRLRAIKLAIKCMAKDKNYDIEYFKFLYKLFSKKGRKMNEGIK